MTTTIQQQIINDLVAIAGDYDQRANSARTSARYIDNSRQHQQALDDAATKQRQAVSLEAAVELLRLYLPD